uniref:Mannose-P-dolichol utilization defect 1 protein homolog n=1 Tax=Caligus clemensi TaxID=344056 RepID=C1C0P5_CALCM|nr:Mannose-P-dolichol utilization defect 1 protein [Caligus clemensi]
MDTALSLLEKYLLQFDLISPKCFEELFLLFHFSNMDCLSPFLFKILGIGIILGSTLVKVPQVLKVMGSGSSEGLSLFGTLLELLSLSACGAYSIASQFPFTSYGEIIFLSLQTALLALLIIKYSKGSLLALLFISLYGGGVFLALKLPKEILWYGQAANIPIAVSGKMLQVIANYRNGHTGRLSSLTVFLIALGSFARILTSIKETGDPAVILSYVASTSVNVLLALQVIYYWKARPIKNKRKKKTN